MSGNCERRSLKMEIFQLAEKKKAFAPPEKRYKNPFKEAIKVGRIFILNKGILFKDKISIHIF